MPDYHLWTHGVDTVVEFPERPSKIVHAGWGTLVRQPANTIGWFHIAIPTPTVYPRSTDIRLRFIRLRAEVNENARISRIHFRVDGRLIHNLDVMLTDQRIDQRFNSPDVEINGGLALCMFVEFLTGSPEGQVIFRGAGARFESIR